MMLPTMPVAKAATLTPSLRTEVYSLLAYFSIFQHPLTLSEVRAWLAGPDASAEPIKCTLEALIEEGKVWKLGDHYQILPEWDWVSMRENKNIRAAAYLPIARRKASFIARFPFVRAVMVSGSLSKHCMAVDGDIDYFIITTPGRLWLARTLLVLYKKLFLFNSHQYFCVNYFIDTDHLEIEEKNRFTATECLTLLPFQGGQMCQRFFDANAWAQSQFFQKAVYRPVNEVPELRNTFFRRALEWCLGGYLGQWADSLCMRLTVVFWQRKFKHFDAEKFDSALKSRRYVSKHHPLWFQQKVLARHQELMEVFLKG